jgi:hypothetical protein
VGPSWDPTQLLPLNVHELEDIPGMNEHVQPQLRMTGMGDVLDKLKDDRDVLAAGVIAIKNGS